MYKLVPQVQSNNDGEDSESELFNSSIPNFEEKSPQYEHSRSIAAQQQTEQPSMSIGRKIALAFSIVNCVVFVILFLWILPCDFDTCRATPNVKTKDWEVNLKGKGVQAMAMASSPTSRLKEMLILLSSETSHFISAPYCFSNETNTLLGIRAADGKLLWEKNFTEAIQYMNCSLIDVNSDGVDDCILFPVAKNLSSLNPLTGTAMWEVNIPPFHYRTKQDTQLQIIDIGALADVDNDAISDLAIITTDSKMTFFIGVSGRNGQLLWQFALNASCFPIGQSISVSHVMSYPCLKEPPDYDGKNVTGRFLADGRPPLPSSFSACRKCDALTDGIPKTRYLFHRSVNDFLIRAVVDCSTLGTNLLRKRVVEASRIRVVVGCDRLIGLTCNSMYVLGMDAANIGTGTNLYIPLEGCDLINNLKFFTPILIGGGQRSDEWAIYALVEERSVTPFASSPLMSSLKRYTYSFPLYVATALDPTIVHPTTCARYSHSIPSYTQVFQMKGAPDCPSARCGIDAGCKKESDGSFICICTHDFSPERADKACPRNVVASFDSQFPGKNMTLITFHRSGQEYGSINMGVKGRPLSPGLAGDNLDYSEYPNAKAFTLTYTMPVIIITVLIGLSFLSVRLIRWIRIYRMTNRNRPSLRFLGRDNTQKELFDSQLLRNDNIEPVSLFLLREWIVLEHEIGEGCFGKVFSGRLHRPDSSLPPSDPSYIKVENSQAVAIKVLKTPSSGMASISAERELLREARTMASFSHENILTLHGIVINECNMGPWVVFEYMELGDLAQLLRSSNGYSNSKKTSGSSTRYLAQEDLQPIAEQIANGMKYLSSRNFIHRDLACRNCLVGERPSLHPKGDRSNLIIKISDFGMSRDLHSNDYYKMEGSRFLPIRWMPPEAILYGKFSEQSDVWSFGVLLWEIFSMGAIPYYGHANDEVITMILSCIHLEPPNSTPPLIRQLMTEHCWKKATSDRLSFAEIYAKLTGLSNASPSKESQVNSNCYVYLQTLPDLEQ